MVERDRRHRLPADRLTPAPPGLPAWGNADGIEGIAPALVITAERDRLRSEAATYARKLEEAGSLVEYREVPGVDHGYDILDESAEVTRQMYEFIADHVKRATGTASAERDPAAE